MMRGHSRRDAARCAAAALVLAVLAAASPPGARAADTFTYDAVGRLTLVSYGNGGLLAYTYDDNGNVLSIVTSLGTTAAEESPAAPLVFALGPATPNPGPGARAVRFSIPGAGHATFRVFDASGRLVATPVDRALPAGRYEARLAADRWAAGVYFYRLTLGERTLSGRMVVLR
jgi:YD repeat-containing protein